MLFKLLTTRLHLQDHLDEEARRCEASICDQLITSRPSETPFSMTGLYDLIPDADPSPLRIDPAMWAAQS